MLTLRDLPGYEERAIGGEVRLGRRVLTAPRQRMAFFRDVSRRVCVFVLGVCFSRASTEIAGCLVRQASAKPGEDSAHGAEWRRHDA